MAEAGQDDEASSKMASNIIKLSLLMKRFKLKNQNQNLSNKCHICTQEFNCYTYHCLICKNGFKVCSKCFEKRRSDGIHEQIHPVVRCDEDFNGELFGVKFTPDEMNLEKFEEAFKDQIHANVKCDCCGTEPVKGLRFKCDVCFDYDMCLKCFKAGRETKTHKAKEHPMIVVGKTESFEIDHRNIELLDKLGEGAFGAVFRAKLKKEDKIVACKIIECDVYRRVFLGLNPHELLKSFVRELAVFKQVKGDNVHRLIGHTAFNEIDIKKGNFQLVIITEIMEKGSLANLLQKEPDLPYLKRLEMAIGICSGMARIHDLNFIHRDIRSDNILVDKNYTAKIADMGIAKVYENNTKMTLIGCREYMPPDFYTGKYTKKLDIFTYGLTLNEMFEGLHGYNDALKRVLIKKKAAVFYDIVQKCINPQPELRPDAKTIEKELSDIYRRISKEIEKNRDKYDKFDSKKKNEMFKNILYED